jgi:hypothetical protein
MNDEREKMNWKTACRHFIVPRFDFTVAFDGG